MQTLRLSSNTSIGSYFHWQTQGDIIHNFYYYKKINITLPQTADVPARVLDTDADRLLAGGYINARQAEAYVEDLSHAFTPTNALNDCSMEDLYQKVQDSRICHFGADAIAHDQADRAKQGIAFDTDGVLDQSAKKEALLQEKDTVIFALFQAEFFPFFQKDLEKALQNRKNVYILCHKNPGYDLPCRQWFSQFSGFDTLSFLQTDARLLLGIEADAALQKAVDENRACLLVYGEEGLLQCRNLLIDAVTMAIPGGYHARAVVNQLGFSRACVVYIPAGLDITQWVQPTQRAKLTYWQLAKLAEDHSDKIYHVSVEQLYRQYPQYFLNIYENGKTCAEAAPHYPIQIPLPEQGNVMTQYEQLRDESLQAYLNQFANLQYTSTYFNEHMENVGIDWQSTQPQPGILVQSARIRRAKGSTVAACPKGKSMRQVFDDPSLSGPAIVSNFLFFLTGKLATLYNDLRKDRPREQANVGTGHLDYMLTRSGDSQIETFPLFRKTCLGMTKDGEFLFFNFRLGGGQIQIGDVCLRWEASQVDTDDSTQPILVYSPYFSVPDGDADRNTYRKIIGDHRINLVILQDRIAALRKGDVVLPSVGVVISLDETLGQHFIETLSLQPLEDGYYDVSSLQMQLRLDPPAEVTAEKWQNLQWAYGGGLSLILQGKGLCDDERMDDWFTQEGWMSPLSRQTQESNLHTMAKHPRTAIGITKDGDLVILVYSGRTNRSSGADYQQMIQIARSLYPDIDTLMNADGGGSAVLGMALNGHFMELSYPSTSGGSCVGMARPIHTVFYIPLEA